MKIDRETPGSHVAGRCSKMVGGVYEGMHGFQETRSV
jgi:hypothetical protein